MQWHQLSLQVSSRWLFFAIAGQKAAALWHDWQLGAAELLDAARQTLSLINDHAFDWTRLSVATMILHSARRRRTNFSNNKNDTTMGKSTGIWVWLGLTLLYSSVSLAEAADVLVTSDEHHSTVDAIHMALLQQSTQDGADLATEDKDSMDEDDDEDEEPSESADQVDIQDDDDENDLGDGSSDDISDYGMYLNEDEDDDDEDFNWADYDEDEHNLDYIFMELDCPDIFEDAPRPIHGINTWKYLRETYIRVMGDKASITPDQVEGTAFQVPITVEYIPGKGRAVVAAAPIAKGTKVHRNDDYTAVFRDGAKFREYLQELPEDLACDVMIWSYVEYLDLETKDDLIIGFELDEASFTNGADDRSEINVDTDYVAIRDIAKGEEIVESYDDFVVPDGWAQFGL